ncbi:hypothetical protein K437DRAFT_159464 [Tilletiaria anomala UBC 951]|uniref:Uncharacterized protein n=1 Tax=Tilletiaria anomala (strain ATCC 24038 / CBS 436.72 / UBC 951) TaxID=1037660 RepID=A0A066VUX3_TILAU|nr:uncharacterized protein K437DRAFT_159464 [Tilletiaria anomala UBC 951]KDN42614.1 hypothetical protein K437DRAFT_159464 [Tilletiaria anomala UBC 951]
MSISPKTSYCFPAYPAPNDEWFWVPSFSLSPPPRAPKSPRGRRVTGPSREGSSSSIVALAMETSRNHAGQQVLNLTGVDTPTPFSSSSSLPQASSKPSINSDPLRQQSISSEILDAEIFDAPRVLENEQTAKSNASRCREHLSPEGMSSSPREELLMSFVDSGKPSRQSLIAEKSDDMTSTLRAESQTSISATVTSRRRSSSDAGVLASGVLTPAHFRPSPDQRRARQRTSTHTCPSSERSSTGRPPAPEQQQPSATASLDVRHSAGTYASLSPAAASSGIHGESQRNSQRPSLPHSAHGSEDQANSSGGYHVRGYSGLSRRFQCVGSAWRKSEREEGDDITVILDNDSSRPSIAMTPTAITAISATEIPASQLRQRTNSTVRPTSSSDHVCGLRSRSSSLLARFTRARPTSHITLDMPPGSPGTVVEPSSRRDSPLSDILRALGAARSSQDLDEDGQSEPRTPFWAQGWKWSNQREERARQEQQRLGMEKDQFEEPAVLGLQTWVLEEEQTGSEFQHRQRSSASSFSTRIRALHVELMPRIVSGCRSRRTSGATAIPSTTRGDAKLAASRKAATQLSSFLPKSLSSSSGVDCTEDQRGSFKPRPLKLLSSNIRVGFLRRQSARF